MKFNEAESVKSKVVANENRLSPCVTLSRMKSSRHGFSPAVVCRLK